MRRSEREITNQNEVIKIIEQCEICHLALSNDNIPYIVPLNFGYEYKDEKLTLYFHGAKEGKKIEMINQNPVACFEMEGATKLQKGEKACHYTMEYESVIGNGKIIICKEKEEKMYALKRIMKAYEKEKEFTFSERALEIVTIFKLEVTDFTGKRHQR